MAENIGRPDENSFGNQSFSDNLEKLNIDSSADNSNSVWGNNQAKKIAEQKSAQDLAKNAEESALAQSSPDDARTAEAAEGQNEGSFYRQKNTKDQKAKFKASKKYGPLGAILGVLLFMMVAFSGATSLSSFALVANGLQQFNITRYSMNARSSYLLPRMLRGGLNSKITTKGLFGFGKDKFKISASMSKKLAANGINYLETTGTDGKPLNVLVYNDGPDGKPMVVSAYKEDAARIPDTIELTTNKIDADGVSTPVTTKIDVDSNNKMGFRQALDVNDNFFKAEERSTRTLKGHVAGWFDSIAEKVDVMLNNGGRNRQANTKKDASDEEITANAEKDGLKEEAEDSKGSIDVDDSDADAEEPTRVPADEGSSALTKGMDTPQVESALKTRAKKAAATIGSAAAITAGLGYACTVLKVINSISQTVGALMRAKVLNYVTGYTEAVHKTKAGDGSTELHFYNKGLNTDGPTRDIGGNIIPGKESSSAMKSPAVSQFFSNGQLKVKSSDPVARKFNTENAMQQAVFHSDEIQSSDINQVPQTLGTLLSQAAGSLNTYKGCVALQTTGDLAGIFADVAEIAAAIPSFGISLIIGEMGKMLMKKAVSVAIVASIGMLVSMIAPYVARALARSLVSNMVGEDAGYAINSGFNMYTGMQQRMSSGLPATKKALIAQYHEQQSVIASESRYDRQTKSPLDPSSPHTFMGSLMNSLIPLATTMSSPIMTFSKINSAVASSISRLLPTAAADDINQIKTSINDNCPSGNAFEEPLAMDAFCNNYITTDYSTMRTPPDEVFDQVGAENFDLDKIDENVNNGNPEIKDNSELAKWTLACAVRESHYGVADSNISEATSGSAGVGSGLIKSYTGAAIGAVPVVGGIVQTIFNGREAANIGWTTGENCVKEKYKYFSRYSEDQRVLEAAGLIEQSAVTAYLDRYFEKNPLDYTDSGIVARYTGMTKDQAEVALGLLEYNTFLASYQSKDKGPEKLLQYDNYQYEATTVIAEIMPNVLVVFTSNYQNQRQVVAMA